MSGQVLLERIMEPRLVINNVNKYIALIGANNINYNSIPSTAISESSIQWTTCDPPGGIKTIVGRKMYITVVAEMQFTAATGENTLNILQPGYDGLRAYPFSSCVSNLQATVNNHVINTTMLGDTIHARSRYFNHHTKSLNLSESYAMKDKTQDYSDLHAGTNAPLGILGDSGLFAGESRGVITEMDVITNTPTSASIRVAITEPIFLFPLEFATNANETAMAQIDKFRLDILYSHPNRMWCHDFLTPGSTKIDTMQTTITQALLHVNFIDPPNGYPIPDVCILPFDDFQPISTSLGTIASGQEITTSSQVVQLHSVPQQLFVYAKMSNSSRYSSLQNIIGSTDTFAQISNVSITYDNKTAILAEARPIQLYQACVANGLQDSFQEFRGEINDAFTSNKIGLSGTVLRLMFGKDIAANGSLIPGLDGRTTFSLTAKVKNVNYHTPIDFELWVVPVYEGLISLTGGTAFPLIAPIANRDEVSFSPISNVSFTSYEEAFGNGFFDVLGKIAKGVGNVLGLVPTPITQGISAVAKTIGSVLPSGNPTIPAIPSGRTPRPVISPGAPVGAQYPVSPLTNPNFDRLAPVGSPVYRAPRRTVRRRATRRGYGIVANGLVNDTVQGGRLASLSALHRRI